ncbi:hypothetical protein BU15DRAFT_82903 [Melanogaster broomeanus]|nr:hypothetical protein BU15DRAFT_82903 [Melanogaster broomeanus]
MRRRESPFNGSPPRLRYNFPHVAPIPAASGTHHHDDVFAPPAFSSSSTFSKVVFGAPIQTSSAVTTVPATQQDGVGAVAQHFSHVAPTPVASGTHRHDDVFALPAFSGGSTFSKDAFGASVQASSTVTTVPTTQQDSVPQHFVQHALRTAASVTPDPDPITHSSSASTAVSDRLPGSPPPALSRILRLSRLCMLRQLLWRLRRSPLILV